jgi:hypothetical protein
MIVTALDEMKFLDKVDLQQSSNKKRTDLMKMQVYAQCSKTIILTEFLKNLIQLDQTYKFNSSLISQL